MRPGCHDITGHTSGEYSLKWLDDVLLIGGSPSLSFIQELKKPNLPASCPTKPPWKLNGGDMGWLEAGVQLRWDPAEGQCSRPAVASLCCRAVWYWCCSCCPPPSRGSPRLAAGCSPRPAAAAARTIGPKRTASRLSGSGSAAARRSSPKLQMPVCSPTGPSLCELLVWQVYECGRISLCGLWTNDIPIWILYWLLGLWHWWLRSHYLWLSVSCNII